MSTRESAPLPVPPRFVSPDFPLPDFVFPRPMPTGFAPPRFDTPACADVAPILGPIGDGGSR